MCFAERGPRGCGVVSAESFRTQSFFNTGRSPTPLPLARRAKCAATRRDATTSFLPHSLPWMHSASARSRARAAIYLLWWKKVTYAELILGMNIAKAANGFCCSSMAPIDIHIVALLK